MDLLFFPFLPKQSLINSVILLSSVVQLDSPELRTMSIYFGFTFRSQIKEEQSSDKSGTDDADDSDNNPAPDINDYNSYENIFRPRHRELNRTPTGMSDEEFEVPLGSEPGTIVSTSSAPMKNHKIKSFDVAELSSKNPAPVLGAALSQSMHTRLLKQQSKKASSPSPTQRIIPDAHLPMQLSQPSNVRMRRSSSSTSNQQTLVHHLPETHSETSLSTAHSMAVRITGATSVQPRAAADLEYRWAEKLASQKCSCVYSKWIPASGIAAAMSHHQFMISRITTDPHRWAENPLHHRRPLSAIHPTLHHASRLVEHLWWDQR